MPAASLLYCAAYSVTPSVLFADEAALRHTALVVPSVITFVRPHIDARLETTVVVGLFWVPVGVNQPSERIIGFPYEMRVLV